LLRPGSPVIPEQVKAILDSKDVDVAARNNHSQKGDEVSFKVTWAIIVQCQHSICLKEGETNHGLDNKIIELCPPFEFKDKAQYNATWRYSELLFLLLLFSF
jgi:hypothetical protein